MEGEPPLLKHNMMRVMYLIIEGPAPTLKEPGNWSDNFNEWLGKCLVKVRERLRKEGGSIFFCGISYSFSFLLFFTLLSGKI